MRAVLVILLIVGIACLALGLILVNGTWEEEQTVSTHLHNSEYGSAEICLTCHQFDMLDWSAAGVIIEMQGTIVQPASVLRGSATITAPLTQTPQTPESGDSEKTAEAENQRLP